MKKIVVLVVSVLFCLVTLFGCINGQASVYVDRNSELSLSPYDVTVRDIACTPIFPFSETDVIARSHPSEPLLWTFGINFDVLSPAHNPLGCLRLYQRDDSSGTVQVVPIDGGGILVDTCNVVNGDPSLVLKNDGFATFSNGEYIECEMDLRGWVASLSTTQIFTSPVLPNTPEILSSFALSEVHAYQNFTMMVKLQIDTPPTGGDPRIPIMSYSPTITDPITFSIGIEDGVAVTTPSDQCTPTTLTSSYSFGQVSKWWYDVRDGQLSYVANHDVPDDQNDPDPIRCEVSSSVRPLEPVSFTVSLAKLYIGNVPIAGNEFSGTLDGILIDPTDSKPPELH